MTQDNVLSSLLGLVRSAIHTRVTKRVSLGLKLGAIALLVTAPPALAHHPFGGETPKTIFAGFLSGIGHPVIGIDHLAFVIAVGLLAAVIKHGWTIPSAFLTAALMGAGIHLMEATLPAPEVVISASVLLFGLLALSQKSLSQKALTAPAIVALTGLAGMFHGYAYGEAIVGAEPTPLIAYLVGFTLVQGAIAFAVRFLLQRAVAERRKLGLVAVRLASSVICGMGAVLLAGAVA